MNDEKGKVEIARGGWNAKTPQREEMEKRLRKMEIGEVVHYEEWGKINGGDHLMKERLRDAIESVEAEGIFFEIVPKVGCIRLTMAEATVSNKGRLMGRMHRVARKISRRNSRIDVDQLDPDHKAIHGSVSMLSNLTYKVTASKFIATLAKNKMLISNNESPPIKEILKLYENGNGK